MSNNGKNKNSLFLIELIMVIFFFSIMSAICVTVFAKAYTLSNKSSAIDKALLLTQNAAECIKNSDGTLDSLNEFFKGKQKDTTFQVFYDDDFETTEEEQATYELKISFDEKDSEILIFTVAFLERSDQDCLMKLDVKKYLFASEVGE